MVGDIWTGLETFGQDWRPLVRVGDLWTGLETFWTGLETLWTGLKTAGQDLDNDRQA
jgi:hypothetical protein